MLERTTVKLPFFPNIKLAVEVGCKKEKEDKTEILFITLYAPEVVAFDPQLCVVA